MNPTPSSTERPRRPSRRDCLSALVFTSGALVATALAGPARAQRIDYERIINHAGRQRMLTQRMSKEIMLIALDHDVAANLQSLQSNSDLFARVLRGLRSGDREFGLPPTTDEQILAMLTRVDDLWPMFRSEVSAVITSGSASRRQVTITADTNLPLLRGSDDVVKAFEVAARSHAHSMLAIAVNLSGAQRMLSQKMSKELYLIALGQNVDTNRRYLSESMARFAHVHNGLVSGDSELRLLPAPTAALQAQLARVEQLWIEFRSMIAPVAGGEGLDDSLIADSATLNVALLSEMNTAVGMYEALKPQA